MTNDQVKMDSIKKFLAEAWCIDGEITHHWESITIDNYFELTDSKRGKMKIAILPVPTERKD